jgi:hypothetical protein
MEVGRGGLDGRSAYSPDKGSRLGVGAPFSLAITGEGPGGLGPVPGAVGAVRLQLLAGAFAEPSDGGGAGRGDLDRLRCSGGWAQWYDVALERNNHVPWSRGAGWALLGLLDTEGWLMEWPRPTI